MNIAFDIQCWTGFP